MKNIFITILFLLSICSAQAQLIKEKAPVNPKYLAGAVPMVDGKVVFSKEIPVETSLSADSLYKVTSRFIARTLNRDEVLKRSGMVKDEENRHMEVGVVEYITFKRSALILDRTQIIYKLSVDVSKEKVSVLMSDISYYYEEERSPEKYTAEEWISDETALKKNKKDFVYNHGKFRTSTIDLFEQTCNKLTEFFKTL